MNDTETNRILAGFRDQGLFERLATSVLRAAEPCYASLVHPGVNAEGKTVRSPLDGITFVPRADPPHMIAVHHTTCSADKLESKWCHSACKFDPLSRGIGVQN
jgi:hypothetical protein